jgi:broad specificity phosphatase PhoE
VLVVPDLNEPRFGRFEGGPAHEYGVWAWESGPLDESHGGEHRGALAARYARGLRLLSTRPEDSILLVAHSVTLRYLFDAAEGRPPSARVQVVEYAAASRLDASDVARAIEVLATWAAAPSF